MAHSLLFVLGKWAVGGVERVTVVLANEFTKRGYSVAVAVVEVADNTLMEGLDPKVVLLVLGHEGLSGRGRMEKGRSF